MSLIENELGSALHPPVKRKANKTPKLRNEAARVSKHATEVMVKVTSFGSVAHSSAQGNKLVSVRGQLRYISRKGDLELENERGEILKGKEAVKELAEQWEADFLTDRQRKNRRDTMHMVVSMPEGTPSESVREGVRAFAKATFGANHEYVFAIHTDEPHPHAHLTVKMLGFDGTRLNPRKDDLQAWREAFADAMRDQGEDVEATPRRSRGVTRRPERNVIRHIERGDKTHAPRVPRVLALKVKEIAQELAAEAKGAAVTVKPWEQAIAARREAVRRAWLEAASALDRENPRLTFGNKEAKNERPDYLARNTGEPTREQRTAALYQSGLGKARLPPPPGAVAGLRNLSGLDVVHDRRAAQVLLQPDARRGLGRQGSADPQVRRPGAGADRASGEAVSGRVMLEGQALATAIRQFVQNMPAITTERAQIKADLARRFAARPQLLAAAAQAEVTKASDQDVPKRGARDAER